MVDCGRLGMVVLKGDEKGWNGMMEDEEEADDVNTARSFHHRRLDRCQ